jgi:hypothetical protein
MSLVASERSESPYNDRTHRTKPHHLDLIQLCLHDSQKALEIALLGAQDIAVVALKFDVLDYTSFSGLYDNESTIGTIRVDPLEDDAPDRVDRVFRAVEDSGVF